MTIALDATYTVDRYLTGVGVYCREIAWGVARSHPDWRFQFCYRPHRYLRSCADLLPGNATRRLLWDPPLLWRARLFHGMNQRLPRGRLPRTVTTFHDLFVLTGEYSTPEFRARFAQMARDAAARSDLIICVSSFTASQVHALLGVDPARLRLVPHGVHFPSAPPTTPREKVVLHVGAIQKRKNLVRLVRAFAALPEDWRLVLAGSEGYGAAEVREAITRSPRRHAIEITGYLPPEKLEELYWRASIFAFPSLDEGFGMPVLEAMAHRVPVITSNCSALPETAGGAALLINPQEEVSLAEALRKLAGDEALRAELADRGFRRASAQPWQAAVDKTWAVYQELLGP